MAQVKFCLHYIPASNISNLLVNMYYEFFPLLLLAFST